uniref:Uncharacterized protein n=1 Tax=Timema bartmani TaxID=61472 RepID=A0A7R9FCW9_9NEOP|nr:unnamed protein product [Timema bartmani]
MIRSPVGEMMSDRPLNGQYLEMDISKSQHDNEVALIFETVILWSSSLALKEQETNLDQGKRDGRASSKDYVNCNSQIGDYVLYNGLAEKSYKVLQKVSLDLPISTSTAIIHCIQAIDIKADGNAASVSVTSGGLNTNYVTLHFESERGHGVHFNVTILLSGSVGTQTKASITSGLVGYIILPSYSEPFAILMGFLIYLHANVDTLSIMSAFLTHVTVV